MSVRVVLDVNTLASAVVFPRRTQGLLVARSLMKEIELVLSDPIIVTLQIVLERPYFIAHTTPDRRSRYVSALRKVSMMVSPDEAVSGICDDEEDDLVLGTAVAAGAGYLVTGDKGLLAIRSYGGVSIVTAREFLPLLDT